MARKTNKSTSSKKVSRKTNKSASSMKYEIANELGVSSNSSAKKTSKMNECKKCNRKSK